MSPQISSPFIFTQIRSHSLSPSFLLFSLQSTPMTVCFSRIRYTSRLPHSALASYPTRFQQYTLYCTHILVAIVLALPACSPLVGKTIILLLCFVTHICISCTCIPVFHFTSFQHHIGHGVISTSFSLVKALPIFFASFFPNAFFLAILRSSPSLVFKYSSWP